jgi:hypothetical protein
VRLAVPPSEQAWDTLIGTEVTVGLLSSFKNCARNCSTSLLFSTLVKAVSRLPIWVCVNGGVEGGLGLGELGPDDPPQAPVATPQATATQTTSFRIFFSIVRAPFSRVMLHARASAAIHHI